MNIECDNKDASVIHAYIAGSEFLSMLEKLLRVMISTEKYTCYVLTSMLV